MKKRFGFHPPSTCLALAVAVSTHAAPIRVVFFNSCGPNGFIHTISQQTPLLEKMLLSPATENLQNPIIPADGFTVDSIGPALQNGNTGDGHKLILALPDHDVVVCVSNSNFAGLFNTEDQKAFLAWARRKGHGVVALHAATMDNGVWPEKIEYFGADYIGWNPAKAQILRDTTPGNSEDPNFSALNAGLETAYTVNDEWMSFRSQPRSVPGIHVVTTLNEATYTPAFKMGDHPISWYRAPADSGRFFYNAAGHDWQYIRDDYWLRRQIYNGILWASGWVPASTTTLQGLTMELQESRRSADSEPAQVAGNVITVSISRDGPHEMTIFGLDGKRVSLERGRGARSYTVSHLKPNSVYLVLVSAGTERTRQLVKTQ
jgi:type 1 glutamine amidotransferase